MTIHIGTVYFSPGIGWDLQPLPTDVFCPPAANS